VVTAFRGGKVAEGWYSVHYVADPGFHLVRVMRVRAVRANVNSGTTEVKDRSRVYPSRWQSE
jgi:hypothetical protein